jgi:hypothetical protein
MPAIQTTMRQPGYCLRDQTVLKKKREMSADSTKSIGLKGDPYLPIQDLAGFMIFYLASINRELPPIRPVTNTVNIV